MMRWPAGPMSLAEAARRLDVSVDTIERDLSGPGPLGLELVPEVTGIGKKRRVTSSSVERAWWAALDRLGAADELRSTRAVNVKLIAAHRALTDALAAVCITSDDAADAE